MKKISIFKRLLILILVFMLSINSIAAVVSDNDGATFITKAEFDSLKNNFQAQIDNYNTSIDSKIEGAIASYLAGIAMATTTNEKIINSSWNDVIFKSGVDAPTFGVPGFDMYLSVTGWMNSYSAYESDSLFNDKMMTINSTAKYSGDTMKRPLFGVLSGSESSSSTIVPYWRGIAQGYREYYNLTSISARQFKMMSNLDVSPGSCGITVNDCFKITKTGYLDIKTSPGSLWSPTYAYYPSESSIGDTWTMNTVSTNVVLDVMSGKQIDKEHIISYKNSTWTLSNETFLNTFYQNSANANTATTLKNTISQVKDSRYVAVKIMKSGSSHKYTLGSVGVCTFNGSTDKLSSIGMIGTRAASSIYQYDYSTSTPKKIKYLNKEYNIPNVPLTSGFQLIALPEDVKCEWKVDISNIIISGGSATEADIYLSYAPYTISSSTGCMTSSELIHFGTSDHVTTSGRKAKVSWKHEKDGLVYALIVPHFSSASDLTSRTWEVKLNLAGESNNVSVTTQN